MRTSFIKKRGQRTQDDFLKTVQIQVKCSPVAGNVKTKSFTVHGWKMEEVFFRIADMFKDLESNQDLKVVYFKEKEDKR